ncbi:MAG: aldo/keto reductase, partial [Methanospirillum sp.]|nr:aldo/keto reductase [Methanospirillum sp.]
NRLMTRAMYGIQLMGGMGGTPACASLCRNCGKCVTACPQHISIPDELKKVGKTLDGLRTRTMIPIVRMVFSSKKIE